MNNERVDKALEQVEKARLNNHGYEGVVTYGELRFILQQLKGFEEPKEEPILMSREYFRSVMSEYTPSIAEDSDQPEWAQGELDRAYNDLILQEGPYSQFWEKK